MWEYALVLLFVCEVRAQDPAVELDTGVITGKLVDLKGKVLVFIQRDSLIYNYLKSMHY